MSYRKITVDGKQYEYVIGKTHLKIKAFGLFRVSDVGNNISGTDKYVVTPTVIAAIIRKEPLPLVFHCGVHDHHTSKLTYKRPGPVDNNKKVHMIDCPTCKLLLTVTDYPEDPEDRYFDQPAE